MKKYVWVISILLVLFFLPSCMSKGRIMKSGIRMMDSDKSVAAPGGSINEGSALSSTVEAKDLVDERKIIWNASLSMYVEDFAKSTGEIESIARQMGGKVSNKSFNKSSEYIYGTIVLMIPSEKLQQFIKDIEKAGKIGSSNITSEDISDQYYDLKARLETKKKQEARLLSLLDREDNKLEDILKLEQELARIRGDIESMEGRKRFWDKQVSYSTVTINITQDVQAAKEPDDIWKPLRKAFRNLKPTFMSSLGGLISFFAGIITLIVLLIPWILIVMLVIFIFKKSLGKKWEEMKKKRNEKKQEKEKEENENKPEVDED